VLRRCVWSRNIKNRCSIYIYDISSLRVNIIDVRINAFPLKSVRNGGKWRAVGPCFAGMAWIWMFWNVAYERIQFGLAHPVTKGERKVTTPNPVGHSTFWNEVGVEFCCNLQAALSTTNLESGGRFGINSLLAMRRSYQILSSA